MLHSILGLGQDPRMETDGHEVAVLDGLPQPR
jgi:hypothetical protein